MPKHILNLDMGFKANPAYRCEVDAPEPLACLIDSGLTVSG